MIKKIVLVALVSTAFLLTGCANNTSSTGAVAASKCAKCAKPAIHKVRHTPKYSK